MIFLLPQLPCKNRYSADWVAIWTRELRNLGVQFKVLGSKKPVSITKYFTDPNRALEYECHQLSILSKSNPERIFCLDVDTPGLITPAIQILRLSNPNLKCFGYLHAGSWCNGDIWSETPGKKYIERAMFDVFDRIFVASRYHKQKIERYFNEEFDNLKVVGFPFYKKDVLAYVKPLPFERKDLILINGRSEQSNMHLVEELRKKFPDENVVVANAKDRKGYYALLNRAKISISLKTEETFGIGQLEAYVLGSISLCPDAFAYPEVIQDGRLLYTSECDLMDRLTWAINLRQNPFQIDIERYERVISSCVCGFEKRR